jgi:2-hydroxychromene-2-carboxylate isomerase
VNRSVIVYYSLQSPWTWLGWERFREIAAGAGTEVDYRVIRMAPVFAASGGLPLAQRPKQRQAYRLQELARWQGHLGVPLNLHPRFFPTDESRAAGMVLAHKLAGGDAGALSGAFLRAVWAEERDLADPATLEVIADEQGLDGASLLADAETEPVAAAYEANTAAAIEQGIFGVPTFVVGDQLYWGQDRLDFVARALA